MKKLVIIFLIIGIVALTACGGNSKSNLSGRWELSEDSSSAFEYLEFFSDGTYTSDRSNYEGSYSVDGNRLRLQGILVDSLTYTFEVNKGKLTLFNDEGEIYCTFDKVSK